MRPENTDEALFNEFESAILPLNALRRDTMDDDSLDAFHVVEDADIDDFCRGGK